MFFCLADGSNARHPGLKCMILNLKSEVNRTTSWENQQKSNNVGQCYSVLVFQRKTLSRMGSLRLILGNAFLLPNTACGSKGIHFFIDLSPDRVQRYKFISPVGSVTYEEL